MTLNEVMKDTADAIREKTGKSEKIAPINFAEEIKSISAGGGESGGSNIEYLDVGFMGYEQKSFINEASLAVKISQDIIIEGPNSPTTLPLSKGIYPTAFIFGLLSASWRRGNVEFMDAEMAIGACCIDFGAPFILEGIGITTVKDYILATGMSEEQLDSIPRITKEQFYTLE